MDFWDVLHLALSVFPACAGGVLAGAGCHAAWTANRKAALGQAALLIATGIALLGFTVAALFLLFGLHELDVGPPVHGLL